jgi:hypothetical protein
VACKTAHFCRGWKCILICHVVFLEHDAHLQQFLDHFFLGQFTSSSQMHLSWQCSPLGAGYSSRMQHREACSSSRRQPSQRDVKAEKARLQRYPGIKPRGYTSPVTCPFATPEVDLATARQPVQHTQQYHRISAHARHCAAARSGSSAAYRRACHEQYISQHRSETRAIAEGRAQHLVFHAQVQQMRMARGLPPTNRGPAPNQRLEF